MYLSQCLECNKIYKREKHGDGKTETVTHGYCESCLEKVKELNKKLRNKKEK